MATASRRSAWVASALGPKARRRRALAHSLGVGAVCAAALLLASCAVEVTNLQAAQELAKRAKPPGSLYTGWRVFMDKCASCHGSAATGTSSGPDLLPRLREMSLRPFVGLVLNRYDLNPAAAPSARDGPARDAWVEDIVQRKEGMLTMPAWQAEPRVNAHIVDLFAYLSARAQGTQGPGRPEP